MALYIALSPSEGGGEKSRVKARRGGQSRRRRGAEGGPAGCGAAAGRRGRTGTHRDAVPGPVHGPHGDAGSAQAAFVHVRGDLTRQAQGEESPTDACEEGEIAQRSSSGSPGVGRHRPALKKMLPPETASTDPLRKL